MNNDVFDALAALACADPVSVDPPEAWADVADELARERAELADELRHQWEVAPEPEDPLLAELAGARARELAAQRHKRRLLAYAREFSSPGRTRPYTLEQLAAAAGLSISGVRTAYDGDDVDTVARATGARRHPSARDGS
ncbi:hypothetical protein H7X46_02760 [Pseudonocardia sp. C8]|uniref:hypothetical protein n=1 Tax=Pseudonocardia sp. C8 TaxID=2762759 RepID=UPI0016431AB1|nr:hypothetical protein [Pseudonocardia sp. C8]MBC3189983.1 hypothetical protein [Pseudonocardia sp. C8]